MDTLHTHPFPRLRWLAPLWLAVYLPLYAWACRLFTEPAKNINFAFVDPLFQAA